MKGLKATLNCIKDSETILGGEYYVVHSDFIIALEENINKLNEEVKLLEEDNTGERALYHSEREVKEEYKDRIDKAIEYIEKHKETREHYEPFGTPMGNSNYITTHISGYYELLDILKGSENSD